MEVQPPWASELLARNRKVARNICWSTSLDSSSTTGGGTGTSSTTTSLVGGSSNSSHLAAVRSYSDGMSRCWNGNNSGSGRGDPAAAAAGRDYVLRKNVLVVPNEDDEQRGDEEDDDDDEGGKGTLVKGGKAAKVVGMRIAKDEEKVVDPLLLLLGEAHNTTNTSTTTTTAAHSRTEKQVSVLDSDDGDDGMRKDRSIGDDGGFEYGPGIVMKLRSKYQSLALRQNSGRPALRRSASLENCLDQGCDPLVGDTPSPSPYEEDEIDGRHNRKGMMMMAGKKWNVGGTVENNNNSNYNRASSGPQNQYGAGYQQQNQVQQQQRGRNGYSEYNSRDRMRRARSVDALHRSSISSGPTRYHHHHYNHHGDEKEILEKLKNVALPKEEIVIIEVSKPRANFGDYGTSFAGDIEERQPQFSRSLHHHIHNSNSNNNLNGQTGAGAAVLLGNGSELNRVRSLTSPEHELPPPDIVRETARIFEKNQDNQLQTNNNYSNSNSNSSSSSNNQVINGFKKVGHALRLSKGSSNNSNNITTGSPNQSPLPSPTTPSSGVVHTSGSLNGQGGTPYQVQNKGHLSAQGLNALATSTNSNNSLNSSTSTSASHKGNKLHDGRNNSISNGHSSSSPNVKSVVPNGNHNNYSSSSTSANSNLSATKQVGVIRPTVNPSSSTPGLSGAPVINGHVPKRNSGDKSSTSISSSSSSSAVKSTHPDSNIMSLSAKKPPLGPKPLVNSAPNNIFLKNNKTGSTTTTMTESSTLNGTKSPEPSESERVRSPTSNSTTTVVPTGKNNTSNNNSNNFQLNKTMEIPLEKENEAVVMEFQQITLKPVAKPKEHSEIILPSTTNTNNTTGSKSFTPLKTTTTEMSKTEKKDEKSNNKIATTTTNSTSNAKSAPVATKRVAVQQQVPQSQQQQQPVPVPAQRSPSPTITKKEAVPPAQQELSQLRTHQKQKQKSSGGETMVFNFMDRPKVPDYIEDDGLHRVRGVTLTGTVMDESKDDTDPESESSDNVDSRSFQFEGGNVIINGRSSMQKKPKSQKMNISFSEDAPTTFEYPKEPSVLGDEDTDCSNKENPLGHKTPSTGSGLGSYTPSKIGNSYQLGSYTDRNVIGSKRVDKKEDDELSNELIEDYLKPDTGSTTWSSEIGADILF